MTRQVDILLVSVLTGKDEGGLDQAIPFELVVSGGQTTSLDKTLAEGDEPPYFSTGVGCDGCFAQVSQLEATMAERGITPLPLMVNPACAVAYETARFGIEQPFLIDPDARVSAVSGPVNTYGQRDRPSHSFALVRQNGEIAWVRHYADVFVPAASLLAEVDTGLET